MQRHVDLLRRSDMLDTMANAGRDIGKTLRPAHSFTEIL